MTTSVFAHFTAQEVAVPASQALAFLADPARLARWSLGCFDIEETEVPGLYSGLSLFDGGRGWLRISPDLARGEVIYHVGTPDRLVPRIAARVVSGEVIERGPECCLVTLTACKPASMPGERWQRLCAAHETEIWLIKSRLESLYPQTT